MKKEPKKAAPKATKTPRAAKTPSGPNKARLAERLRILDALRHMSQRDHWPKRPRSFEWADSQVVGFIMEHMGQGACLREARLIFECARRPRGRRRAAIFFDHSSRTWRGAFWPAPMPRRENRPAPRGAVGSRKVAGGEGARKLAGDS
jgi:hypothetical protein